MFDLLLVFSSLVVGPSALFFLVNWAKSVSRWRFVWVAVTLVFAVWASFSFAGELAHSFVNGATADSMSQGYCPSPCDGNYIPYDDGILARPTLASVSAWLVILAYSILLGAITPFTPMLARAFWKEVRPTFVEFRQAPFTTAKRLFLALLDVR